MADQEGVKQGLGDVSKQGKLPRGAVEGLMCGGCWVQYMDAASNPVCTCCDIPTAVPLWLRHPDTLIPMRPEELPPGLREVVSRQRSEARTRALRPKQAAEWARKPYQRYEWEEPSPWYRRLASEALLRLFMAGAWTIGGLVVAGGAAFLAGFAIWRWIWGGGEDED